MTVAPDVDALLTALVLVPGAYARNRFFEVYQEPRFHQLRSRAAQLRSVVHHLGRITRPVEKLERSLEPNGQIRLYYELPSVNARRTIFLSPIEVAIIDVALARTRNESPPFEAQRRVHEALTRLAADAA